MCDNDFLLTYNPGYLERHSDSSDFDDYDIDQREGTRQIVLSRKVFKRTEMVNYAREMRSNRHKNNFSQRQCVYVNHAVHPRHCNCNECVIPVVEKQNQTASKKDNGKYYIEENKYVHRSPSRLSVVRSKIMPCLSNIFGRSNHFKRDDSIRGKHKIVSSTKDNACQVYCINCNRKQLKRTRNMHDHLVQSNYSTEDSTNTSPDSGINTDSATDKDIAPADYNINYGFTPSMAANFQTVKKKFRKMVEKEFKKAYLKRYNFKRTQEQQFPSKANFHILSTPKASKTDQTQNEEREITSFGCNVMPSNSSVFWEYIVERINKKYQTNNNNNRGGLIRSCHCTNTIKCPNIPGEFMLHDGTGSQLVYKTNEQATQGCEMCPSCRGIPANSSSPAESRPNSPPLSPPGKKALRSKAVRRVPSKQDIIDRAAQKSTSKVECKCYTNGPPKLGPGGLGPGGLGPPKQLSPVSPRSPESPGSPGSLGSGSSEKRPCQEPHEQIKDTIEKKYNGEILCIHNPPCILINGCLNLPAVKNPYSSSAWPVTQVASFHCGFQNSQKLEQGCQNQEQGRQNQEQGCQYQPLSTTDMQTDVNRTTDKITQSICNHDPPCEVVRCCYKPDFDPKLENSCVHVPMCKKLPACILNESNKSLKCKHQPKCADIPVCKRVPKKYVVLTAKDDFSTQVRPNVKVECKHVPPCIMIPRCLGKLMCDGYVPYDAIPGCVHQPACEMIPACCRKSAKMSSFFRSFARRQKRQVEYQAYM